MFLKFRLLSCRFSAVAAIQPASLARSSGHFIVQFDTLEYIRY